MTNRDEHTGLQQLAAIRDGTAPPAPIQELLGFDLVDVSDGTAAFRYRPDVRHRNPLGTIHGGVAMTLLDSAAGAAVHSTLGTGCGYTTLETKVNLVRAVRPSTGTLLAEGSAVHRGRTVATAESRLVDADGTLYAHGTSTCLILDYTPDVAPLFVDLPTMVIYPEADPYVRPAAHAGLEHFVRNLTFRPVKDGTHWIAEQHPELVNRYIREFLTAQGLTPK